MQIVVTGMHRSGTSAVAGMLHGAGVFMGEKLIGPDRSNPKGHFEDVEVKKINDAILAESGGAWDDPPDRYVVSDQTKEWIKEFISQRCADHDVWGMKDPRLMLTWEFWVPFLNEPKMIVCDRQIEFIARSLKARNGFHLWKGEGLTSAYWHSGQELFTSGKKLFRCHYPDLVEHPESVAFRMRTFLDHLVTPDASFIDKSLRHHR